MLVNFKLSMKQQFDVDASPPHCQNKNITPHPSLCPDKTKQSAYKANALLGYFGRNTVFKIREVVTLPVN